MSPGSLEARPVDTATASLSPSSTENVLNSYNDWVKSGASKMRATTWEKVLIDSLHQEIPSRAHSFDRSVAALWANLGLPSTAVDLQDPSMGNPNTYYIPISNPRRTAMIQERLRLEAIAEINEQKARENRQKFIRGLWVDNKLYIVPKEETESQHLQDMKEKKDGYQEFDASAGSLNVPRPSHSVKVVRCPPASPFVRTSKNFRKALTVHDSEAAESRESSFKTPRPPSRPVAAVLDSGHLNEPIFLCDAEAVNRVLSNSRSTRPSSPVLLQHSLDNEQLLNGFEFGASLSGEGVAAIMVEPLLEEVQCPDANISSARYVSGEPRYGRRNVMSRDSNSNLNRRFRKHRYEAFERQRYYREWMRQRVIRVAVGSSAQEALIDIDPRYRRPGDFVRMRSV